MRGRYNCVLTLFSFTTVLSQWVFLVRFLTRQIKHKRYCTFPTEFFLVKVLMRHILDGHLRGSVMNNSNRCPLCFGPYHWPNILSYIYDICYNVNDTCEYTIQELYSPLFHLFSSLFLLIFRYSFITRYQHDSLF